MILARRTSLVSEAKEGVMFGLDEWIAGASDEGSIAIVLLVAILLGLRHATDPDHLAAVSTLVVSGRERATRRRRPAGRRVGPRPRGHARGLRRPDPPRGALPPRARAARRGDDGRGADRLPRGPAPRPLAARRVRLEAEPRTARTGTRCARRRARSASGSCTGWAAARASASCCSQRSRRGHSRSSRSSCSRCSRPCR